MQLSKTVIFALLNIAVAVLAAMGVVVTPEVQEQLAQHIDALLVAFFGINGVIVWILRALTDRKLLNLVQKVEP